MRTPDFDTIFRHLELALIEAKASRFWMLAFLLKMAVLETTDLLQQHSFPGTSRPSR